MSIRHQIPELEEQINFFPFTLCHIDSVYVNIESADPEIDQSQRKMNDQIRYKSTPFETNSQLNCIIVPQQQFFFCFLLYTYEFFGYSLKFVLV